MEGFSPDMLSNTEREFFEIMELLPQPSVVIFLFIIGQKGLKESMMIASLD